jgi:membrane-bound lytic murein transglycosylase D
MKHFLRTLLLVFGIGAINAQEVVVDSILDGPSNNKNSLKVPVSDSLNKKLLEDNQRAKQFDSIWREELYSSSLFDTVYKTISEQTYEEVYLPELPTDTLKKRLEVLNARTPFNVEYNPSLESVIKSYLKYRRSSFEKLMGLSAYYFPMFEQDLDRFDLPLEIKYLAIVESALKPRAKSRVGASGLWQFMFGTGKQFGLNVSSYVDERYDPIKATEAACKYLSSLYKTFN